MSRVFRNTTEFRLVFILTIVLGLKKMMPKKMIFFLFLALFTQAKVSNESIYQ